MTTEKIVGKYKVIDSTRPNQRSTITTDNPIEAVWEANRLPNRIIVNVCGERSFYKDKAGWHITK